MSFQAREDGLTELFKGFGAVARVRFAMDRETAESRGFAFLEMPNAEEAARAIVGLNSKELVGRDLKMNVPRPRTERIPLRGATGGGSGGKGFSTKD
jgi:cold-inducible RNA-binding protein